MGTYRQKRFRWKSEESEDLDLSDEDYSPFADCGNRAEEPMMRTRSETADGSDQTRQETEAIEGGSKGCRHSPDLLYYPALQTGICLPSTDRNC